MKTIVQAIKRAEDVVKKTTDRHLPADQKPTELEQKLAHDVIKISYLFLKSEDAEKEFHLKIRKLVQEANR